MFCAISYYLHNLKNVKNSHALVLLPATLLKVTPFRECFSRFLDFADDSKSRKVSHMVSL